MWSAIMSQVEGGAVAGRVFIHQSALRFLRVKIPAEVMAMVMLVGCSTLSIGHIQILKTESLCTGWRWWWPSWHGTAGVRVTLHLPRVPGAVPVITAPQICLQSGESTTVIKTSSCCLRKVLTECRDDVKHFYCNVIKLGWILQQLAAVVCLDLLWIFTEHECELHGGPMGGPLSSVCMFCISYSYSRATLQTKCKMANGCCCCCTLHRNYLNAAAEMQPLPN